MEDEDGVGKTPEQAAGAGCKKHAGLHRPFLHLYSRALAKLHGRRARADDAGARAEPPPSSASASFLSGCMHPRTHSFASARRHHRRHSRDHEHEGDALGVNFRSSSLRAAGPAASAAAAGDGGGSSPSSANDCHHHSVGSGPAAPRRAVVARGAGVAVVTFSAAPYEDFRRSMREMVDAAAGTAAPAVDWDLMEELLFCYLHLNDRAVHKDVLRAFTDTVAAIRWKGRRERRRRRQQQPRARRDSRHGDTDGEEELVTSS